MRSLAPLAAAVALACGGGTAAAKPGLLGADCVADGNADCASNLCLKLDSSTAYCTQHCSGVSDCGAGYICLAAGSSGSVCQARGAGGVCNADNDCPAGLRCDAAASRCYIPVTRSACGVCTSDKQCGTGGVCHAEGSSGEAYCAPACGSGDTCATGFTCLATSDGAKHCLPAAVAPATGAGTCRGGRPLCAPCTGDLECGKPGDLCVRNLISDESFCGRACTADADCPQSFSCTDLSGSGAGPRQCTPNSDTCAGYCDSTAAATVERECGLGSSCDLASNKCVRSSDGRLCAACTTDDDCKAQANPNARCIVNRTPGSPAANDRFCGADCSVGTCPGASCSKGSCLAGFECVGIGDAGGWPYQCAPVRGSCQGGLGVLGDNCDRNGSGDCVSGICGQFGTEHRCSSACTQDAQCGDNRFRCCKAVGTSSYDCTTPASGQSGVCAPVGGSFGDDCAPGSPPCQEGLCLDLGTAQLCTRGCTSAACPTGFSCQQAALTNEGGTAGAQVSVCFPDGGGDVGADCAFGPAACSTHLCLKKDSGNVCTKACTAATDCPATWSCGSAPDTTGKQTQVCLPPGT